MKKKVLLFFLLFLLLPLKVFGAGATLVSNQQINDPNKTKQDLKVLVVVIDPILNSVTDTSLYPNNGGHPRASEWFGHSAEKSINSVLTDIRDSSHGYVNPIVVKTEYLNEYPRYTFQVKLKNGSKAYSYDEATYIEMGKADSSAKTGDWYQLFQHPLFQQGGDSACVYDYEYLINKLNLVARRNNNEFDQVWIFSISPMGLCEAMMVGRTAYDVNGDPIIKNCDNFVIFGWELARPDAMFHSEGHMAEHVMTKIYGTRVDNKPDNIYGKGNFNITSKAAYNQLNYWEKFILTSWNNNSSYTGVGNTHFPFNAIENYGYYNSGYSLSNWREWLNYPNVTGDRFEQANNSTFMNNEINTKLINNPDGGYTSVDRMYQRFWFSLLPHITGYTTDGYSNNWWKYLISLDYVTSVVAGGSTSVATSVGKEVTVSYILNYSSGKAEELRTIPEGNNVNISNKNVVGFKNGKLYGKAAGTSTVKVYYDGKSITFTVTVMAPTDKKYKLNTSVSNLGLSLGSGYSSKLFDKNSTQKTSGVLATGDIIEVYYNGQLKNAYSVIVLGDVTGSGTSTVSDVAKLYQYLKGKITMEDCYKKAGNVVSTDNDIKINDVAKLYQYIKGKISSLE